MSLSQIAELGFPRLAKAFEWTWQERKGSEVGGNLGRQAAYLFVRIFLILQLC